MQLVWVQILMILKGEWKMSNPSCHTNGSKVLVSVSKKHLLVVKPSGVKKHSIVHSAVFNIVVMGDYSFDLLTAKLLC